MHPADPVETDLVTLLSAHGVTETVERLKALLAEKGIELFAHVDHAAGARQVGLPLRPTQVLIFGNPRAGTPLMQSRQTIGLDLPLRILVWEDDRAKTWLTYRRLEFLAQLHGLRDRDEVVKALGAGLSALADPWMPMEDGRGESKRHWDRVVGRKKSKVNAPVVERR